jgi:hypothetical protein
MQWSAEPNAGFTDGEPWLPVNPNHEEVNVETERDDPDSVWHYYRDLVDLRDDREVVVYGSYDLLLPDHEELWAYTRTLDGSGRSGADDDPAQLLVVLNLSDSATRFELPDAVGLVDSATPADADLLLGNHVETDADHGHGHDRDRDHGHDHDRDVGAVETTDHGDDASRAAVADARSFTARPWEARVYDLC